NDFGWMSLIGVILCYLISLFVLVPVLYLLDRRAERKAQKDNNKNQKNTKNEVDTKFGLMLGKLSVKTANNPIIVIGIAGLLTIGGLYADEHVDVQTDVKKFVPDDMAAMIDLNKLHDLLGGTDNINIIVKSDDVTNPSVLKWMYEFGEREVELHGDIKRADSIATSIKITTGSIPKSPQQTLKVISALPDTIKERYLYGNTMSVIDLNIGTAADLGTARVSRIIENVESDIEWYPPPTGTKVTITGHQVALTSIMGALTSGRTFMTILGLVMIFLGLLVIYRDPIHAFVPILPILMVTGWAGGVMYILNLKYNPLTATLGALVIGIGAEFTILMMERYYEEREKGKLPIVAMETAASRIGPAIIASGSTVLFGFSALIFTTFPMLSSFGVVTVISVAFALLSTLIVLPPVMVYLDKWIKVKNLTSKNKPF
ncbi:MAG: RND family transporter, partial [Methanosarcinales archaeon]